jgi:hypothetical protein
MKPTKTNQRKKPMKSFMRQTLRTNLVFLGVLVMTVAAPSNKASAANIFANTSFEGGSSAGWGLEGTQATHSDAIGKATDFGITVNPSAGDYVLKLTGEGGWAQQNATATIAANTSYTLSYDIWLDSSNPQWSGQARAYFMMDNGDPWAGPLSQFYNGTANGVGNPAADYLAAGQWYSVSRTVDASFINANPNLIGTIIGVAFSINPQQSGGITYYVDNVQMNAVTVPEPSSFALALGGIANLLLIRRRRTA